MAAFRTDLVPTTGAALSVQVGGSGPAVLLLHGFPETKVMWRDVVPQLATQFTVVCADLRGYGASSTPALTDDHLPYSKRALAADMVEMMSALGRERFAVAGHDRGGRVAYRAALDHPQHITHLAALDVLPVDTVWDSADARMALGFWPWSLLAQPEPLPEELIGAAPAAVLDHALGPEWGTPAATFPDDVRSAYLAVLNDPAHVHAICEEYRAAATVDRVHDAEDRRAGHRIICPVLVLWSGAGPLASWYSDQGGPLGIWRALADDVSGTAVDGGHFFPEEHPDATVVALERFFRS